MDRWNIQRGADVRSADDEKLGKIIGAEGQYIVVEKGFFFPTDYYIPASAIASVDADTVYLTVGKDQALNSGWDQMADSGTTDAYASDVGVRGQRETTGTIAPGFDAEGAERATATDEVLRVDVHEEELTATKRPVDQGAVRVEKDVVTEEQTLNVPVTEERVRVTRRAVDREDVAGSDAFEEGTVEVPLRGEEVDVQKRVRVAEEVDVAKEAVPRTEKVSDTVRREQVRVEDDTTGASGTRGA